jgi:16S rRNA (uracil1498-N3)-methyltransferase
MSKFFVEENQISENRINIIGQDVNHIKNVLRYKVGDVINICSSSTAKNYECSILDLGKDVIECQIIKTIDFTTESNVKITIFQGLPKADKMELIIQKCTELGAIEFVPWNSKRSIVKLQEKDVSKKISRWQELLKQLTEKYRASLSTDVLNILVSRMLRRQYPIWPSAIPKIPNPGTASSRPKRAAEIPFRATVHVIT